MSIYFERCKYALDEIQESFLLLKIEINYVHNTQLDKVFGRNT